MNHTFLIRAVSAALCFVFSVLFPFQTRARSHSDFLFKNIGIEQGLSARRVYAVEQDREGFMWFGTEDGLNRYDGYEIKVFRHEEENPASLSDSKVNCLLCDTEGYLWVGTNRGLNLYCPTDGSFTQSSFLKDGTTSLEEVTVRCLYEDSSRNIWVGTMNGLYRIDRVDKGVQCYTLKGMDGSNNRDIVRSILEDVSGNFWIGTFDGLFKLDARTGAMKLVDVRQIRPLAPENNLILSLINDPEDSRYIWVGSETGLHRLDTEKETYLSYTKEDGLSNNVIKCLLSSEEHFILAGTDDGLNLIDLRDGSCKVFLHDSYQRKTIANDIIWDVICDENGHHWFATNNGVSQVVFSDLDLIICPVEKPYSGRPTPDNQVVDIAFDQNGGKYFSLDNRAFFEDAQGHRTFYHFSNYSDIKVKRLLVDRNGTVWAGTTNSLWYKDVGKDDFERISSRRLRYVNSLSEDQDGNIWVESVNGMCRIVPERDPSRQISHLAFTFYSLENSNVRSVRSSHSFVDAENRVWFMSKDLCLHVFSTDGKEIRKFKMNAPDTGLKGTVIYSYVETSRFYVLTDAGLHRYEPEEDRFVLIQLRTHLDAQMTSMVKDRFGNLWVSSGSKLLHSNGENGSVIIFDLSDYLDDKVLPDNPLHVSPDGRIWIGGYNQYFYFSPKETYDVSRESALTFTDFKVFGRSLENGILSGKAPEVVLDYDENSIEVCYSAMDFHSPQNIQYATRLDGIDKQWKLVSGVNKVSYSNLAPGRYVLRARAGYSDESWCPEAKMQILIRHPWWSSGWAVFCYFLLGAGLFYYLWRSARTSLKLREKVRMEKVERQAQEDLIQYKIRFFTNISHELKTPLALIIGPMEEMMDEISVPEQQKKLEIMHSNASRLLRMVNQVMDFNKMDRGAIRLHPVEGELVGYISKIYEMFTSEASDRNISYDFLSDWKSYVTTFDDDKVEKILYNLLSNAFKFTPDRGTVTLRLRKCMSEEKEGVEICVEDTGTGIPETERDKIFTRFYQSQEGDMNRTGTGIGLSLAKDFVDMMGGEIQVSGGAEGETIFTVRLPLEMKNYTEVEAGEESEEREESRCILFVDDNLEMCSFMALSLEKEYKVVLAHNGEEGLRKVRKYNPDIIISDLMMPVMDGLEFCRRIKEDQSFSHIPFILLTAKDGDENVYSGLQTGADAYISKPFNMKLLKLRLENLYESRKKLQDYICNRLKYGESDAGQEEKEEFNDPFMDKVVQTIQDNLADDTLDVGTLSDIMSLPKQQLYRKVKALTGLTVVELIRSVRLEAAATRLRDGNDTISEIMYSVGFSNNSYFSKCFADQYKLSPSEYRKQYRTNQ